MIVFKYPLRLGVQTIDLPEGTEILTARLQPEGIKMWALVDDQLPCPRKFVERTFVVIGTGFSFTGGKYIASIQDSMYVWHVFEAQP